MLDDVDDEEMESCNGILSSSSSSAPFFPPSFNILHMMHHHQLLIPPPPPTTTTNSLIPPSYQHLPRPIAGSKRSSADGDDEVSEDDEDDFSQPGGAKKRRLSAEQVRTLEKNFELGNKLEPERKMQLARALGLKPRQVAIWFQNRRARWKTKQLEKDFDLLKSRFDAIKAENDALHSHNRNLQAQILSLKGKETPELINLNKETEGSCSNRSENSSEINLDISRTLSAAAAESRLNHSLHDMPFFSAILPSPGILPGSSRQDLHCAKIEHGAVVGDENLSNLLCGMDDQNPFWPWPDHHSLH